MGGAPVPFGMAGQHMALPMSQQHFSGGQGALSHFSGEQGAFGDMLERDRQDLDGGSRKRSAETLRKRCASNLETLNPTP